MSGAPRPGAPVGVAVMIAVALVAAAMAVTVVRRDAGVAAVSPPGTTSPSSGTAAPSSFDAVVEQISAFVAEQRGHPFKHAVPVTLLDDDAFEQRLLQDALEDKADIEDTEAVLRALGLLADDVDLFEQLQGFLGAGVLGFYDPKTDELVVRGTDATPYVRETIAHELTHALDDQYFELDRPDVDNADDESGFGFAGLVEGNAVRVEKAYLASLPPDEQDQAAEEEASFGAGIDLDAFPLILLQLIAAPYQLGPALVQALLADGGEARVDAAFAAPPTTSEQLLDPARYLAGEGAVPVDPPPADGDAFDQGSFGQLVLLLLLQQGDAAPAAREAANGWGGDWYVAWHDGERTCIRVRFVGDTAKDTTEIGDGLRRWAAGRDSAVVEPVAGTQQLTACG